MVTSRFVLAPLVLAAAVSAQTFINYSGVPSQLGLLLQGGYARSGVDPCHPSPCGPNTECSINHRGVGVCRCLPGYFPKPDTVTGCGPQCTSDSECPGYRFICRNQKCVDPCQAGNPCGINAECNVVNRAVRCTCPPGYEGSPYSRCSLASITARASGPIYRGSHSNTVYRTRNAIVSPPAPPSDPCSGTVCGPNAECDAVNGRAVCSCPAGYQGNPLTGCRRGECTDDVECPLHQACIDLRCQNPCSVGVCGSGADCNVENHGAICSCPVNHIGDPFISCRYDPEAACSPSPCGTNTNCKVEGGRAVCSCIQNYIGNPLSGCRPECVSNGECAGHQTCVQNRCQNACSEGACGQGARCEAVNHRAVCSCPQYYRGNGLTGCYPECTSHSECAAHQACFQLRCTDPCAGACGVGAECKVTNHKAICSCPKGYEGHPFDSCRPAQPKDLCSPNPCGQNAECNPGTDNTGAPRPVCTCPRGYFGNALSFCQRGECETAADCSSSQACYGYHCRNPCISEAGGSVCGTNALCNAKNHKAVCYCPQEYTGDPLTECRLKPVARSNIRRYKRFLDGLLSLARKEAEQEAAEEATEEQ
ncbi:neurogenic locus notch homolog protein 1-like isoform X1 [Amphibalanus amphitrite]|uniref:neurogenic locus notch homolog protein 1-like isoform X1 n=1 Tax=Amphibalanus amphitrite TaxID=1232801 RepID=UPI001C901BC8|nr:neurogenic locus notch homolog protein 1-like isoform X1 [Amphibalanus amphitrite]